MPLTLRTGMYKKNFCKNNLPFRRNNLFPHFGEVQKLRQDVEVLLNLLVKTADVFFFLFPQKQKCFFYRLYLFKVCLKIKVVPK